MANSRVSRGRKTQADVAQWFRDHGWVYAESTAASLPGKDINGMPSWAPEVKATRDGSLTGALKQAKKNAAEGETPFVVWRPDGYGEERIAEWVVAIRLADFTHLMRQVEEFQEREILAGFDPASNGAVFVERARHLMGEWSETLRLLARGPDDEAA